MLSARLAKVINLLIAAFTICLCNAREYVPKSGQFGQRTTKKDNRITAEVQGNYPNFQLKLTEKENFVNWKVNESQPLFGKGGLRAARFQNLTIRPLSKEIRIWKWKCFPKSRLFSIIILKKINWKNDI